jgi:DNA-directed RNA polymerase specialized sigma24 family protein
MEETLRKNWLAAAWGRRLRAKPVVPDAEFQDTTDPHPGHWRRFSEPWPAAPAGRPDAAKLTYEQLAALDAALDGLPDRWRDVLMAHDVAGRDDRQVADEFDLTVEQERDILTRARAAARDQLDRARPDGER